MINNSDISFILDKTKLDLKKLVTLIEEERDFHLLLDSISKTITDSDRINYNKLSDIFRTRLGIYHFCKEDYDIEEKIFISNIMSYNYDYYYQNKGRIKGNQDKEVKDFIKTIRIKDINSIKIPSDFDKLPNKTVNNHIKSWISIINSSKTFICCVNKGK